MPAIGPRHGAHRVPISFTDDELVALGGYRRALRDLTEASRDERRVVNENRSSVALNQAYRRTAAAVDRHREALETLNATLREE